MDPIERIDGELPGGVTPVHPVLASRRRSREDDDRARDRRRRRPEGEGDEPARPDADGHIDVSA